MWSKIRQILVNPRFHYWFTLFVFMLPNLGMFYTESTGLLTRIVAVVLPLGVYMVVLTLSRRVGKVFWWMFPLVIVMAWQFFLLFLFGESPIAVDMFLNLATTNVTEVNELLGNMISVMALVVVMYGSAIALAIVSLKSRRILDDGFVHGMRHWGYIVTAIGLVLLAVNFATDKRFKLQDDVFPVNGLYNLGIAVNRYTQGVVRVDDWRAFDAAPVCSHNDSVPEVYILVIGETSRAADYAILGYDRPTTPALTALGDSIVSFTDAITMSNTTHKSVPLLLTGVAAQQSMDSLYTQCGLINAFSRTGYQTAYYSNQRRNHSFIDRLGSEADEVKFLKDSVLLANVYDEQLLQLVQGRLARYQGGKLLIVLHLYGSHFKYDDRYPEGFARFTPDHALSAEKEFRDELINAYDNTIAYTDNILGNLIAQLDSLHVASALMYTSDHGEDIFDDYRGRFLHASPLPTYWHLHVPLVVWASQSYRSMWPDKWDALRANAAKPVSTNMVMYHTMLDVAGITTRLTRDTLSLAGNSYTAPRRLYVNDHNNFVPLNEAGLKPIDIERMVEHGLNTDGLVIPDRHK